jgi:hypothetical protein
MEFCDTRTQLERRKQLFGLYLKQMGDIIGDDGAWHGSEAEMGMRERLWHCMALLEGNPVQIKRANLILERLSMEPCHFAPMNSMQLLLQYGDRLSRSVIDKLEGYVKSSLERQADERIHFTMYNDNFASMATFTLLSAGERFGNKRSFEAGREKLRGMAERYMRCGALMEYCSTTYLSITITCMAEIYNWVKDEAVRGMALKCEERAWAEAASHFHAPSGHMAGPYSRAYTIDTLGNPSGVNCLFYAVFGDGIIVNPVQDMFPYREGMVVHHSMERLMWPAMIWSLSGVCHCPAYLGRLLLHKPYPYTAMARAEYLPSLTDGTRLDESTGEEVPVGNALEYQGSSGPIYTYMTEDYAMGTAWSQVHDGGLCESFHAVYRKKAPACDFTDTGVAFSRYIINGKLPETKIQYSVYGLSDGNIGFRDEGRKFGIQHGNCSLMVYKPKQFEAHSIRSMKLSILLPCHFSKPDEIWIGGEKLKSFAGESAEPQTVFVKDGTVCMAFTPLALTDHGRQAAVRVEEAGRYVFVSFYNYEGEARPFTAKELFLTCSGFVANIGSAADSGGFGEFMAGVGDYTLSDRLERSEGGYTRWIRYKRRGLDLHFAYSPISEGIMVAAVNGRPRPEPVFSAGGIVTEKLPFMAGDLPEA